MGLKEKNCKYLPEGGQNSHFSNQAGGLCRGTGSHQQGGLEGNGERRSHTCLPDSDPENGVASEIVRDAYT